MICCMSRLQAKPSLFVGSKYEAWPLTSRVRLVSPQGRFPPVLPAKRDEQHLTMLTRRFSIGGLVCLAAVLSSVADEPSGELQAGNLCREESASCLAPGDLSGIPSPDIDEFPPAGSTGRWAEGRSNKRRRRVGFSHEDVAGDESLQPFLQAFKDSLSGTRKDVASQVEQEDSVHATSPGVSSVAEGDANEVTTVISRRALAGTEQAEDPTFFPNGGTYHEPIAVSLVSDDSAVVYYTTDGTAPDGTSTFVTSSELIVLEESVTIRAIAAFQDKDFDARSSAEVEASFVVYVAGKCGHAYFVPHFTSSGYSGNVVEVELQTDRLGSVRLHGVVTDFADFYSDGGVGPYTGQVVSSDLTAEGDSGLAGYWGGFSGDVDGETYGFLSPLFDGDDFHGKAVQIRLDGFGGTNVTRFCGSLGGALETNATCTYNVVDLEDVDPDLRGFSGGFLHASKAYFVPSYNGRGAGAKFVRVDAGNFSSNSVEVLDLHAVDPEVGGFFGGFAWEGYGYLVPCRSFQGPVGGVNTNLSADGFAWSSSFLGSDSTGGGNDQKAGRLQPAYSGKLVRVDLSDFSSSGVQVLDLTEVDPDLRGFTGGFAAGHWGFLVPFKNKEADGEFSGKMVRFDLRTFDHAGVTVLDLTRVETSLRGFVGGFTHGRYAILSPYANGNTTGNYRGRSQFSQMVAVDLTDFTVEGVSVVDLAATSRQQIPYQPDPNLRGYVGGFSLGHHVYLTPHFNGVFFGKVARVDMREMLTMAAGERAANYDGLQVLDLGLESTTAVGFSGAFHSWETHCY